MEIKKARGEILAKKKVVHENKLNNL